MKDLKEARIRAGLTQDELAIKIGVTRGAVALWEQNRRNASPENIEALIRVLDFGQDVSPLATWLTKARSEKNWTVPELAHRAGLSPSLVQRIESGETRNVPEQTRTKLEEALSTELEEEAKTEIAKESEIQGLGSFEDFDPHNDGERPAEPGIYVLYDISERPIYVGEGGNVRTRIKQHEEKFWFRRPIVESASWIRISDSTLRNQIETLLIKFLKSNAVINKQNVER